MERPENFLFDTRIRRRVLAKGLVTQQQVESHLSGLPDSEGAFVVLDVAQPAVAPPPSPEVTREAPQALKPVDVQASESGALSMPATLQSPTQGADDDVAEPAPPTPVMINPAELRAAWESSAGHEPPPEPHYAAFGSPPGPSPAVTPQAESPAVTPQAEPPAVTPQAEPPAVTPQAEPPAATPQAPREPAPWAAPAEPPRTAAAPPEAPPEEEPPAAPQEPPKEESP